MATSQDFVNWVCGPKLDHNFLRYVLLSEQESFLRFASGTTHQTIYFPEVKAFHIALPSLGMQRSIAATLLALDKRIETHQDNSRTLVAIAQTLFRSWFIDFDPVRAKKNGRSPAGMPADVADIFPSDFVECEFGSIPKGWRAGSFGDICQNMRSPADPSHIPGDTPYVGLEHVPRSQLALFDFGRSEKLESNKSWFDRGDVLFGKLRPYFHKVVLAPTAGVCSTDILVLRPAIESAHAFMAMHAFSVSMVEYATRLSNGAKMPRTSWNDLAAYKLTIPPERVMRAFNQIVQPMFERVYTNSAAARALAKIRDSLLPRLISGRMLVPEIGRVVEEVAA